MLPAALYGREIWSLTLREEHKLRVSENKVLARIFGPRRDEVREAGLNCIMRISIVCALHQTLLVIKSRRMRWAGHVARMREMRHAYRIFTGEA
jgi:hypothetical protein